MSFDTVEQSVQDAAPVELYEFAAPVATTRVTTYHKDITFGGNVYTAVAGIRSNLMTADAAADPTDVTIDLPAAHALAQQYVNGIPMRELLVTITRYHPVPNVFLEMWQGYVSSVSFKERTATFRVPSGTADALQVDIPTVACSRLCNNILYDNQCQVVRASFQSVTTISSISADGKTIVVGSIASIPAGASPTHGEVLHATSQERRTITSNNGTTLVLQAAFPNGVINIGDSVTVFAGCDHLPKTCKTVFANLVNFGGHPVVPQSNLFYVGLINTRYHF